MRSLAAIDLSPQFGKSCAAGIVGVEQERLRQSGSAERLSGNGETVTEPAGWAGSLRAPTVAVVVLAAGSSGRIGAFSQQSLAVGGRPVVARSFAPPWRVPGLHRLVLVVRPEGRSTAAAIVVVLIHDEVRPVRSLRLAMSVP